MKYLPSVILALAFAQAVRAEEPTFEYFSFTGKDLFPSAIISTATVDWSAFEDEAEEEPEDKPKGKKKEKPQEADEEEITTLGDTNGWLGVALHDVPKGADLKIELTGDGWMKPSKFVGKAQDADGNDVEGELDVLPKGVWDYEVLRHVTEQRPVNLSIKVTINGKELPEQTETLVLRSVNDCPFFVINEDAENGVEDISWCFAAYVNENHPWIDGLLKEALTSAKDADGSPLITAFTGYQGDSDEVLKQVFAIWQVLQRRGIKYSDVSTTTPSKTVVSQTVRFVDQTVDATQANCVDGSVLMASILTKIGLNAYLVMVPGHCFLAFDGDKDGETLLGLETTMLGQDNLKSAEELKKLEAKAADKKVDSKKMHGMIAKEAQASMNTFMAAIETGISSLTEHADALESAEDPNTQLISIKEWREAGIMPLASGKDRK